MGGGVNNDIDIVSVWWARMSTAIPSEARGLWFGLFEESTGASIETGGQFTMYVTGSPSFDEEDGGDWATDQVWVPEDRYVRPPGLSAIATTNWPGALDYATRLVRKLQPWTASSSVDGVGVGFDDGDATIVWTRAGR